MLTIKRYPAFFKLYVTTTSVLKNRNNSIIPSSLACHYTSSTITNQSSPNQPISSFDLLLNQNVIPSQDSLSSTTTINTSSLLGINNNNNTINNELSVTKQKGAGALPSFATPPIFHKLKKKMESISDHVKEKRKTQQEMFVQPLLLDETINSLEQEEEEEKKKKKSILNNIIDQEWRKQHGDKQRMMFEYPTLQPKFNDVVVSFHEPTKTLHCGFVTHDEHPFILFRDKRKITRVAKKNDIILVIPTHNPQVMEEFIEAVKSRSSKRLYKDKRRREKQEVQVQSAIVLDKKEEEEIQEDMHLAKELALQQLEIDEIKDSIPPPRINYDKLLDDFSNIRLTFNDPPIFNHQSIYQEFSQPFTGNEFFKGRSFAREQSHFDLIPVTNCAKFILDSPQMIDQELKKEITSNIWMESLYLCGLYQYLEKESYRFMLMTSTQFTCFTGERVKFYSDIRYALTNPSLENERKIFIKYCREFIRRNYPALFQNNHRNLSLDDPSIALLESHNNIKDLNTTITNVDKSNLSRTFKILTLALNEHAISPSKDTSLQTMITSKLITPIVLKQDRLQLLLDFLNDPNQSLSNIPIPPPPKMENENYFSVNYINKNSMKLLVQKIESYTNFAIAPKTFGDNKQLKDTRNFKSAIDGKRRHITAESFSIDQSTTKDVDDAISVIKVGNEYHFLVHVSDVTEMISPNSKIDQWALNKSASLYLPDRISLMLPEYITYEASLAPKKQNKCLTFQFKIDPTTGEIGEFDIYPSLVENIVSTTYSEVDHFFEGGNNHTFTKEQGDQLHILLNILKKREEVRSNDLYWNANARGKFTYDQTTNKYAYEIGSGPSQMIVSEMAISANNIAAIYCRLNNIPVPNRCQLPPELDHFDFEKYEALYHPTAVNFAFRNYVQRSEITTKHLGHFSLVLDDYTWSTSPIRRYSDIITHRQIKHFQTYKDTFYKLKEVDYMAAMMDHAHKRMKSIYNQVTFISANDYFNQENITKFHGLMVPSFHGMNFFYLPEYGLSVPVSIDPSEPPMPPSPQTFEITRQRAEGGRISYHLNT